VTGEPLDTAAVKVTAVPEATEEDDSVSVVVVTALTVSVPLTNANE
jgi:hypothetical protein